VARDGLNGTVSIFVGAGRSLPDADSRSPSLLIDGGTVATPVAVVTGASRGIGKKLCGDLAR